MKIPAPNFTQIPNIFLDEIIQELKEVEMRVLLFIMRKTFGWHKVRDRISLSQMVEGTKCSKDKICDAIKVLESHKLILKILEGKPGSQKTYYEIIIHDSNNSDQLQSATPPSSQKLPVASSNLLPTKETLTKETLTKEKAASPKKSFEKSEPKTSTQSAACSGNFISLRNPRGEIITLEESLVYRNLPQYETSVLAEAIRQVRLETNPVGNIMKLIQVICDRLKNSPKSTLILDKSPKIVCKYNTPTGKMIKWNDKLAEMEARKNEQKQNARAI